ncbi:MAG: hypothetical protein KGJ09_09225 [Candidatus Omnitrophica bacterium]|nr:hypothetical protein [Candidatus Omnitrophota bacterium]
MIIGFNKTETPKGGRLIDPKNLPFVFCNRDGQYLGPVAWIDLETGEYEITVRDPITREKIVIDGKYQYEFHKIDPKDLVIFLTSNGGQSLLRVTKEYAMEAAALLGCPVKKDGVLVGTA